MKRLLPSVLLGAALVASPALAEFPEKEIVVMVNYGAGGAVDRTARSLQKFLPTALGQTVVVENHGGASGKIGIQKYMDAPHDGYTVLTAFAPATTYVKFKDPKVFSMDDLAVINVQWTDPAILIARKDTGWKTLDDMIEAVKADPNKYTISSSGAGAVGNLLSQDLFRKLGLKIKIVPYKGGGKARKAFLSGEVNMTAAGAGGALSARDEAVVLGAFWSGKVEGWPEAKPLNPMLEKYGVTVPDGGAYRFHAVHADVKKNHPDRFAKLVEAFRTTTTEDKDFIAFADKTGVGRDWHGPDKSDALIRSVDKTFEDILSGK
ncbi:tripartite tricarboxylate transporter substrate binding protein [Alphaproteobacteria bacterium HT1-32]|nr:tripartite tricarboxylate transporter substrate binding protein [Alphaproteobacteria bacterium HT1-32]